MKIEQIAARIEALPEASRRTLFDFLDRLAEKADQFPQAKHIFKFDWEGGFAEAFPEMTSVDLQHQANAWR